VAAIAAGRKPEVNVYPYQLANNVVPGGWKPEREGYNEEEIKIAQETQKILHQPELRIAATCVRVPVEVGHGESVFVETRRMIDADDARTLFGSSPGIIVVDDPVGRIRNDLPRAGGSPSGSSPTTCARERR
jgi:aspartate-semialdehyde dehydrogenase